METLSASLRGFLHQIGGNLSRPDQKFLRDALIGLIRAGRPIVCQTARKVPDRGTAFVSRLDRLEGHLNRADDLDRKVKSALPGLWLSPRTCPEQT